MPTKATLRRYPRRLEWAFDRPSAVSLGNRRRVPQEFDRLASAYARFSKQKSGREASEIIDWVRLRPHGFVLDAACGPGFLARTLAQRDARCFALDISPRMLELARFNDSRGMVPFTLGEVEALPFGAGTFDLVTCTYAFANFWKPLAILSEFARVIRPDGRIAIVDVVAPENLRRRLRLNRVEALRSHLDTRIRSRTEFLKLFEAAGLVVLRSACHRRFQKVCEWLELSPALRRQSAARIRSLLGKPQRSEPSPKQTGREHYVRYSSEWFLLRKRSVGLATSLN